MGLFNWVFCVLFGVLVGFRDFGEGFVLKTKSALSYFGSDSEVAPYLAAKLNHCKHVSIPFVGGGSIIPFILARGIVASDKNALAINFYQVMAGLHGKATRDYLIHRCQHTLSHPAELSKAFRQLDAVPEADRAWAYWAICWIPRKGKGGTTVAGSVKPSVRRNADGGNNASRLRAVADDLDGWASHFERCEFVEGCFRDEMPKYADRPENGYYIDAPWVEAGQRYQHSFEDVDHVDLEAYARRFNSGTVLIRYGENDWIRDLYSGEHWAIESSESRTQANNRKPELWIMNRRTIVCPKCEYVFRSFSSDDCPRCEVG